MLIDDCNLIIDFWIKELERYSFIQLCSKPSADSWSIGQLYLHLIEDTNYYIEQIKICVATDESSDEATSNNAAKMFLNNGFPDAIIEGAPANFYLPQPNNSDELVSGLIDIKTNIRIAEILIVKSGCKGKTKHPGLGYFNATQWFQFAEMHFRHHLRQKKRIDDFLQLSNTR